MYNSKFRLLLLFPEKFRSQWLIDIISSKLRIPTNQKYIAIRFNSVTVYITQYQ